MRNPITKAIRFFKREHSETTTMGMIGGGIIGGIAALLTGIGVATGGAPVIALLAIPAAFVGGGGLFAGMSTVMPSFDYEDTRPDSNTVGVGKFTVVGAKKDTASMYLAQRSIDKITEKYQHLQELPKAVQRKVMAHVKDIEKKAARVRVYNYSNEQVAELSFTRKYIDMNRTQMEQKVATVLAQEPPNKAPVITAPVAVASPKPVAAPVPAKPAVVEEFGKLAKKVDAIEKRMEEIENPLPAPLEKPKLSAPTA